MFSRQAYFSYGRLGSVLQSWRPGLNCLVDNLGPTVAHIENGPTVAHTQREDLERLEIKSSGGGWSPPPSNITSNCKRHLAMCKGSIPVPDGAGEQEGASLPCLNSNISTEINYEALPEPLESGAYSSIDPVQNPIYGSVLPEAEKDSFRKVRELSTQHRKSAFVLKSSVEKLASDYGIEHLGFLTLTFAEHITCPREAQKRLNSLLSHVIKTRYREYVGVMERQKSGRIHYHLLVVLSCDIRTGFNWAEVQQGNYSSAGHELRGEWSFWRKTSKAYRFGRTELLPVKSDVEAMAKYVGKYVGKAIEARNPEDKGVRLVRYSKGARAGTTRFQFHSEGSSEWRRKVATFAALVQLRYPDERIADIQDLSRVLGKRWAYHHRETILALP